MFGLATEFGHFTGKTQRTSKRTTQQDMTMATPRRPSNPKDAAEALFTKPKKVAAPAVERPTIPNAKELVSLKIDSDILAHFQADGPGWQERINETLRAGMNAELGS